MEAIKDYISTLKNLPTQKDSPKAQDPTSVVPNNRRAPQLGGGHSKEIGGMWALKHEIAHRHT